MPALSTAVNAMVAAHPFFTTWVGPTVSASDKRRLAAKLLLYEVRGRPWNSGGTDMTRFTADVEEWAPRPQFGVARARVEQVLQRFCAAPWVAGEPVLRALGRFPAVYWGARFTSGTQWGFMRDVIRRYHGLSSAASVSAADRNRYTALLTQPNVGWANHQRARLLMKYNPADLPIQLPGTALVEPAHF